MATGHIQGSVKYEDIVSKSDPIHSGSPAVYQLRPKKEEIGSLRRMTLGEKDLNKTNRTILLVGETGTGKSTLINTLVNYSMGVKWEDDVWFQIVEDEKRNQSVSQTSDVIVYQIFGFEGKTLPYSLTIIDTPGYGDTRGIERDVAVSERLLDWFRSDDGVHEISAVGLVLKATENRLSDRLMYIFDSVVSLFGKNLEQNIVALITHSDGLTPENTLQALKDANIKCAKDKDGDPLHFMFNNRQSDEKTKKTKAALKAAWDLTTDGISQFTDFLENTRPQKLNATRDVLKSRIRLTACIQNLKERIQLTELQQREIQQTQEALKKHEEEMKNNEKFTVEVDEVYKEKETIRAGGSWWALWLNYEGAVCCTVCEENCHYPGCTVVKKPKSCEVMKDGRCTSCTRKCPVSDHVKENWIYVTKTRKVTKTLYSVKNKYEKEKSDFESLLKNLKKKMEEREKERDQMLDESFQHVVKLEQIALKVDSLSTLVHLEFLIEKMKEKGDKEKIQKLEEMKSQMEKDKGFRAALQYSSNKLTSAAKAVKGAIMKKTKGSEKYKDNMQNLKERIQLTELKQTEIQQTQEALKKHEQEMKNDEKFTVEVDEVYKEKQTIRAGGRWWALWLNYKGAVCCTVCEENCHYPGCTLVNSPKHCEVMEDGRCTSCTRKCPVSAHVKENWIYVTKTRRVKKTLQDLQGTKKTKK